MDRRLRLGAAVTLALGLLAGCAAQPAAPTPQAPSERLAGVWSQLPQSPLPARREPVGAWLDGRFVLVGGWTGPPCPPNADCAPSEDPALRDGAAFDPSITQWATIAEAPAPVSGSNAVVVDGTLYVLTGEPWLEDSPVRLLAYQPADDTWETLPTPPGLYPHLTAAGTRLLAMSGSDEFGVTGDSVFDPHRGAWRPLPDDPLGPSFDRQGVWVDGSLILTARDLVESPGSEKPAVARFARLSDDFTEWTTLPDGEVIGGGAHEVAGLIVFPELGSADGGEVNNWGRHYPFGGILEPSDASWRDLPTPPSGGLAGGILTVADRTLVGGHLLDPRTLEWTVLPTVPGTERQGATVVGGEDAILIWGGATATDNLDDGYLLRVAPAS
ncbi:hypothetical protein ACFFGH_30680 [Lysobacter korlensis]|uniref:Galactose oxidase n=1 Tax=Lysobacter korlensis TaxID=553636 RepID=A0ABV6RZ24_9GAMM